MAGKPNCKRCKKPKSQCKCGRPTVITKAVLRKLLDAFSKAFTDEQACIYAGISTTAFYSYQDQHPEFKEQKDRLKSTPDITAKLTLVKDLKNVHTAKWWAERKMRKEFSVRHEVTGKDGGAVEVKSVLDSEEEHD